MWRRRFFVWCVLLTVCSVSFALRSVAQTDRPANFVWIEGEKPTSANVKFQASAWGRKEFFSNEAWLQVSIDAGKVDAELPSGGAVLAYEFSVPSGGSYAIWNRIGYEFVRSPFAWRIDDGAWTTVGPDVLTTDLMPFETWNELAWLRLGAATLGAGKHRIEIRLSKTADANGKTARVLYASDALCVTSGAFVPNSKFKPNETGRDARDEAASTKVFALPAATTGDAARRSVALEGDWEVCRNDEQLPPADIAVPMTDFPADPRWKAIPVPSDRNESRPDLLFAHRLWYRTRVDVPASLAGRSFTITFPANNLNTTVFVNGVLCGFNKNPHVRFTIDVTKGVKPGQVNEIRVGIRDAWYGYSTNPTDPMKLRRKFNLPLSVTGQGFQDLAYPIWHAFQSGILATPVLTAAGGPVSVRDVFVKPSVAKKQLAADITLANPHDRPATGEVRWEAVDDKTGGVAKTFAPTPFTLAADATATLAVADSWPDPKLWWPEPNPQVYRLRATVVVDGKAVDVSETPFGFREWGSRGKDFTLNGIVWHGWADLQPGETPTEWLANYRKNQQRFMRLSGTAQNGGTRWKGLTFDDALDFFDRNGVNVRRSGILDGEAIGYNAIENDPDLRKKYNSDIKMDLMHNWRDQMVAQVLGERNHPSVMLWSLENEWLYINCINLYSDKMDAFEAEVAKCGDAVAAVDPTRLWMTDGGGAGKANRFPVHGDHYVFDQNDTRYPWLAYEPNPTGGGRGRWVWDQKRPRFLGEDFFANGVNPADYALYGGEAAFLGKAQSRPAAGRIVRLLTEGYRWAGYGAWHLWLGPESAVNQYGSNAALAAFVREQNWTFGSGEKVSRTIGLFNDTFHETGPIAFTWTLAFAGKPVATQTTTHTIPPGTDKRFSITVPMPAAASRREGTLTLVVKAEGATVFRDVKPVSVLGDRSPNLSPLPPPLGREGEPDKMGKRLAASPSSTPSLPRGGGRGERSSVLVFDPQNAVGPYLTARKISFTPIRSLDALPGDGRVLIVGPNALDAAQSTATRIAAWASSGRRVIVLEQKNPLRFQALGGAEMDAATNDGRIAYGEDMAHPALRGLSQSDFYTWPGDGGIVYRNAYAKPTRGAKSIVQCQPRLLGTALAEVPVGSGVLMLCQLTVGEKLGASAVARTLLANLIDYATAYRQEFRPVVAALNGDASFGKALDAIGVRYATAAGPLEAIGRTDAKIAIVSATPANLQLLAANPAKVAAFHGRGGWIVFHGLTPDGIADYNKIVGFGHMIRPFRRERVTFPAQRSPLTAGLTSGDIVLLSGERIFDFTSDEYVASDVFSFVVDYDEVASFGTSSDFRYANAVNGFFSADGWKLINNFPATDSKIPFRLLAPQTITEFTWVGNTLYNPTTRVNLVFDGKERVSFATQPNADPQTFPVTPPRAGQDIVVELAESADLPGKNRLIGIDNIYLKAQRPASFYRTVHPLLNVGGLMAYDRGTAGGGVLLCNVLFKDTETVPVNATKKRTILATLLRNLKAPFAGGKTVIAGGNLDYAPIDLSKQANTFRNERGWFGDANFTFAALPTGRQVFAGVPFQIYDFPTSPVPTAVVPVENEARPIPVNRKADALFFLQTARIDRRRDERERRENKKFEMARYVVTYADAQTATVPVYAEIDIDDFKQRTPAALPGAQIAWTRSYDGTAFSAVAYAQQWNNPRPNVAIQSVALTFGPDRRGVPVLLAVTAATAR